MENRKSWSLLTSDFFAPSFRHSTMALSASPLQENLHSFSDLRKNFEAADVPNGRDTSAMKANALFRSGF